MKLAQSWLLPGALSLAATLSVVGCHRDEPKPTADQPAEVSKPVEAPKATPPASASAEAKDASEHRRDMSARIMGPPGSTEMMLGTALHDTTLTDAQKTTIQGAVDSLRAERGDHAEPRGDRRDDDGAIRKSLAAGVRAGKVDAKVPVAPAEDPKQADKRARQAAALKTLHATLTPDQRKALVDTVMKRVALMGTPEGEGGNDPHMMPERLKHGDRGMRASRVMRMLRDANLTDEQKTKIEKALEPIHTADHDTYKTQSEAVRNAIKAKLATFATDSFDATAYVSSTTYESKRHPMATLAAEVAAVTPLLTPEQRTKLAEKLDRLGFLVNETGPHRGAGRRGPGTFGQHLG